MISLNKAHLQAWLEQTLATSPGIQRQGKLFLTPLCGDAGFRRYFRLNTTPSLLAVMAPIGDGLSNCARHFATLSYALREWDAPVPQVFACHGDNNYLLLEDFGDHLFFDALTDKTAAPSDGEALYHGAFAALLQWQQIPRHSLDLATYAQPVLRRELQLFEEWFVGQLLGYSLSGAERQLINGAFIFLEEQALAQPQVLVHRDYHSRNLLVRQGSATPGIIDFQDAVWGPVTYDLVSLLRDCYLRWPPQYVERWAVAYGDRAMASGLIPPQVSRDQLLQWFDTMGLQRHLKVLGVFARLWLRDNKAQYLAHLPLVLRYTLDIAERYRQTRALANWISAQLLEKIERQPWYRD